MCMWSTPVLEADAPALIPKDALHVVPVVQLVVKACAPSESGAEGKGQAGSIIPSLGEQTGGSGAGGPGQRGGRTGNRARQ